MGRCLKNWRIRKRMIVLRWRLRFLVCAFLLLIFAFYKRCFRHMLRFFKAVSYLKRRSGSLPLRSSHDAGSDLLCFIRTAVTSNNFLNCRTVYDELGKVAEAQEQVISSFGLSDQDVTLRSLCRSCTRSVSRSWTLRYATAGTTCSDRC